MDPILGEIRAVAFNFAPYNWAVCDGSLLQIRQYTALYSLLGITYGGNGSTTFGLPDLRGRAVVHPGQGTGLSGYALGQTNGTENVTLALPNLPAHNHAVTGANQVAASDKRGGQTSPANNFLADSGTTLQYGEEADGTLMAAGMVAGNTAPVGGGAAHTNLMPYLATNYIIALQGIYPARP